MWAMVAVAAATALAQYLNSEQARKDTAAQRRKIEALYNKLQMPNLDPTMIKPEEYQIIGTFVPEAAPYIAEIAPTMVQENAPMQESRKAQLDALTQMRQSAQMERDPALMAMLEQADASSSANAEQQRQAVLAQMQRRGQLGSGMELASQMAGSGQAMARGAESGRAAAIEAFRNRQQAVRDSGSMAGNIYGQQSQLQSKNADIINAFNQRSTSAQQQWANQRANMLNDANLRQANLKQRVGEANIDMRNKYNQGVIDRRNEVGQQKFVNERGITGDRAGLSREQITDIIGTGRDRSQAIQGIGEAGMEYQQNEQDRKKEDELRSKYGY